MNLYSHVISEQQREAASRLDGVFQKVRSVGGLAGRVLHNCCTKLL